MAEFDASTYFQNRIDGLSLPKTASVADAMKAKLAGLEEYQAAVAARGIKNQADKNSLVGILGLDPDSTTGVVANQVAALNAGLQRQVGQLFAAVPGMAAAANQANLSEEDIASLNRNANGTATEEDLIRINRRVAPTADLSKDPNAQVKAQALADANPDAPTPLKLFTEMNKARDLSRGLAKYGEKASAFVRKEDRNDMTASIGAAYTENSDQVGRGVDQMNSGNTAKGAGDVVSGVAKMLLASGNAALDDPAVVAEYITENVPQLVMGTMGKTGMAMLTTSNVGYAVDNYNQGIQNYQKANGGALPPEAERERMALQAASLLAAEQFGDVVGAAATKLGVKAVTETARKSILDSAKNVTKAVGTGVITEAPTEAYQTYTEGEITGKPASGEEIFTGGVIGGLAGGGITGGGRVAYEATLPSAVVEAKAKAVAEVSANQDDAIKTGDVATLTDPSSKTYAPDQAIAALFGNSQLETTTPEAKQANLEKADKILADLNAERLKASTVLGMATGEAAKGYEQDLVKFRADLAATDPADTEMVSALTGLIADTEAELQNAKALDPKVAKDAKAQLTKLDRQFEEATKVRDRLSTLANPAADVAAEVALALTPVTPTGDSEVDAAAQTKSAAAAQRVVIRAMENPELLDDVSATRLAENSSNGLTDAQRTYLRSFSAARIAENDLRDMGDVTEEVLVGRGKNIGIVQYRKDIARAMATGDRKTAERLLGMLTSFRDDHQDKAKVANEAIKGGLGKQILRTKAGSWELNTGDKLKDPAIKENGGLTINSGNLVQAIKAEARALILAEAELRSAFDLKFNTPAAGALNVKDTPQQGSGQEAGSPAAPVQDTQEAGTAAEPLVIAAPAGSTTSADVDEQADVTGPLPWETDEEFEERTKDAPPAATSTQSVKAKAQPAAEKPVEVVSVEEQPAADGPLPWESDAEFAERRGVVTTAEEDSVSSVNADTAVVAESTADTQSTQSTEENQSTEDNTAKVEAETKTEQESTEVGTLTVFQKKSPEGTSFIQRNLIADFFKQALDKVGLKSKKALLAQKDFLSAWVAGKVNIVDFLGLESGQALTERQQTALQDMKSRLVAWNNLLQKNLVLDTKTRLDFKSKDMLQYLLEDLGNGVVLNENVITAITGAAYQWAALKGGAPQYRTLKEVMSMHGKGEGDYVSPEGYAELRQMVGTEGRIISDLGKAAARALGLTATKNAPKDLMPKLETALGAHALEVLQQAGLIDRGVIATAEVASYFEEDGVYEYAPRVDAKGKQIPDVTTAYVKLLRDEKSKALNAPLLEIVQANKSTRDVAAKVFGEESAPRFASLKPIKLRQVFAKRSKQKVSKQQLRVIQKTMDTPHVAIPEMLAMAQAIGRDNVLRAAGWIDLNENKYHDSELLAIEAQNQNLEQQYDLMMEMLEDPGNPEGYETEFFVSQEVWKNFRAGFTTQSLNQQTSKIHRYLFSRPGWQSTLDLDNAELISVFKVSVAQALGVKIDQQTDARTESILEAKLAGNEKLMQAVQAIQRSIDSPEGLSLTAEESALVGEVSAAAEGMQTMQALVAFAKYENARARKEANPDEKVTVNVTMLVGADGKTSGPMLSHLALGAGASVAGLYETLRRGGMFPQQDKKIHFSKWYENPQSQDLYEDLTAATLTIASGLVSTKENIIALHKAKQHKAAFTLFTAQQWDAFIRLTGPLALNDRILSAGRNLAKTPLTAFGFGASMNKAVLGMQNGFMEDLYATMGKINRGEAKISTKDFIASVNELIKLGDYKAAGLPRMTEEKMLKFYFSKQQEAAIRKAFNRLYGNPVKLAMETKYYPLISRRNKLNDTIQVSFATYKTLYENARLKEIEALMDNGGIAYRLVEKGAEQGKRVPLHDMSEAQEAVLRERFARLLPVMHTDYSLSEQRGSTEDLSGGLYMAKQKNVLNESPLYAASVLVNGRRVSAAPVVPGELDPGVAGAAYAIHSLDSAAMHKALQVMPEAMNVHDEIGVGVHRIKDAAQAINESVTDSLLNYSPAREALAMFDRLVLEAAKMLKAGDVDTGVVKQLFEAWADAHNNGKAEDFHISLEAAPEVMLSMAFSNAVAADKMRLGAIAEMGVMDQYPWEGGSFEVTPEIRDEAAKRLANLPTEPSAELKEAIAYLGSLAEDSSTKTTPVRDWATTPVEAEDFGPDSAGLDSLDVYGPTTLDWDVREANTAQALYDTANDKDQPQALQDHARRVLEGMEDSQQSFLEVLKKAANIMGAADLVAVIRSKLPQGVGLFWGKLSHHSKKIASDPVLEAFLRDNPEPELGVLFKALDDILKNAPATKENTNYRQILNALSGVVPRGTKVEYITKDTPPNMSGFDRPSNARGWYTSRGQGKIFVLSSDFMHSGISAELLIHELVHSSLIYAVANPTKATEAYVNELTALYEATKAKVAGTPMAEKHKSALANLDEFLAWGMTNTDFQREVLAQVSYTSTLTKKISDGMKAFVDAVVGILFKNTKKTPEQIAQSGVTALFTNVAAIYSAQAAENKKLERRVLSMESNPVGTLNEYSTLDLHDALNDGTLDPEFQDQLRNVLSSIVQKLHGPFGSLKESLMRNQALTPFDVWQKALDTGEVPFASKTLASGFTISQQEAFAMEQVEATVRQSLEGSETQTKLVYRELSELYMEVRNKLKPADFLAATNGDTAEAQALFDFVFALEKTNGDKMDHLARFAALGLAHKGFNELLKVATGREVRKASDAKGFGQRLQIIFENVLAFFQSGYTKTYRGQMGDAKLNTLVGQLVDIEAKRRNSLSSSPNWRLNVGAAETGVRKVFDAARSKVVQAAESEFFRKNKNGYVQAAGALVRTVGNDRVNAFMDAVSNLRDMENTDRSGMAAGILNAVRGPLQKFEDLLRLAKTNERQRKAIITNASKAAMAGFKNAGKGMSKASKAAVSAVFLRSGAHVLLDTMKMADIEGILGNQANLDKEIRAVEDRLGTQANIKAYIINQANALGYFKATGKVRSPQMMMNAHNIAQLYGTPYAGRLSQAQLEELIPSIEKLVALYAIDYTAPGHITNAKELMRSENQRNEGGENGVEFIFLLHKRLEKESQERLFSNDKTLAMHGYTPEIYNPYVEIKVANELEGKLLEYQGYIKGAQVATDPSDVGVEVNHIYTLKGAGLQPYLSGALSFTGTNAKGSPRHSGQLDTRTRVGLNNAILQSSITNDPARKAALADMFKPGPRLDLSKAKENRMAPVLNSAGEVVNWRYMMSEANKDNLLERNNDFAAVIGTMAGSIFDKSTALEQNTTVVKAMKEQYEAEFAKSSYSYMEISPNSPDPDMREIWRLMSYETQQMIKDVWGSESMMVRKDSVDLLFGYRKMSLSQAFDKDPAARNFLETVFVAFVEDYLTLQGLVDGKSREEARNFAKRAAVVVTRGERAWQELVKEAKDILVVKSGVVLLGNIWSNLSLLWMNGVPIKDMLSHHLVALKGATAYRNDSEELAKIKTKLESGFTLGNEAEMQARVLLLEDALARNPVTEMIKNGLMPTIVEDISADEDIYSYKSALTRKTEKLTSRLNPTVVEIGRQIYMARDTKMYQGLNRATQLSDFVARYTLYQHLTNRKENPLDKKQATQQASDAFVNYDIPLPRGLQFTDDMGITTFSKYFLYIQRVLQQQMRDNPARVLTLAALGNFMSLGPIVLDGLAITRIGNNPMGSGAFLLPQVLPELATVSAAMALIK